MNYDVRVLRGPGLQPYSPLPSTHQQVQGFGSIWWPPHSVSLIRTLCALIFFSSCVYSASVAVCQCMSQTLHYPRDLVLGLEQGQHFSGIVHRSIPTTTFNSTELRDAATIILISIAPAHVGFGPRATHFEELVHLGLHHPVYCALI